MAFRRGHRIARMSTAGWNATAAPPLAGPPSTAALHCCRSRDAVDFSVLFPTFTPTLTHVPTPTPTPTHVPVSAAAALAPVIAGLGLGVPLCCLLALCAGGGALLLRRRRRRAPPTAPKTPGPEPAKGGDEGPCPGVLQDVVPLPLPLPPEPLPDDKYRPEGGEGDRDSISTLSGIDDPQQTLSLSDDVPPAKGPRTSDPTPEPTPAGTASPAPPAPAAPDARIRGSAPPDILVRARAADAPPMWVVEPEAGPTALGERAALPWSCERPIPGPGPVAPGRLPPVQSLAAPWSASPGVPAVLRPSPAPYGPGSPVQTGSSPSHARTWPSPRPADFPLSPQRRRFQPQGRRLILTPVSPAVPPRHRSDPQTTIALRSPDLPTAPRPDLERLLPEHCVPTGRGVLLTAARPAPGLRAEARGIPRGVRPDPHETRGPASLRRGVAAWDVSAAPVPGP